ncbi:MAG: hypothetical protein WA609_02415 [Terriglobales bacterium]
MTDVKQSSRHLFHIPLQVVVGTFCVYWYWHVPAPNKAVLWLGGVAALMTLIEMRPLHKAIYFALIIALIFTENRAIDKDRATFAREQAEARRKENEAFQAIATGINTSITDSERHFNTTLQTEKNNLVQTLGGLKETVNAATGGEGFCYIVIVPPDHYQSGGTSVHQNGGASIIPQGKYPLTNVNILVADDDMMLQHLKEASTNLGTAEDFGVFMDHAQEWIHVGDLPPQFAESISMRAATLIGDRRMLTITFWANNGHWTEKLALRRVNGKWLRLIRVWKDRLDMKKNAFVSDMLFEQVDDGFPEDTNTKDPHGLSVSPSH